MNGLGDVGGKVLCRKKVGSGIKESHGSIDAYTHINLILLGYTDNILHVFEFVPRREAEHERQGDYSSQGLYYFHHLQVAITAPHMEIGLAVTV